MAQLSAVLNSPNLSRPVPDPSRPVAAPPRRQQRQITVNFSSTITRATEQEANMRALHNVPFNPPPEVEESKPLWDWFSSHGSFYLLTNFNEEYLEVLYEEMLPYIAEARRRGTRPKVGWKDALLLYLTWAKTASTYDALAANISITKSCLEDTLKRVRPVLFKTLQARWWNNRLRPKPLPSGDDAFFALLIDSISVEVFRPAGRFDEVKCYWDGKNEMYALKKEVAVTASAPHIALFTSKAEVGSTHDFKLHKNCFEQYLPYLAKRDQERTLIPTDADNQNWAVLGDSAYSGPATLQERRVALKKPSSLQTVAERIRNTQLARIRVPVEQFFGRLTQLWGIIRGIYRWDHIHFDEDFDICVLLTNENTNQNLLTEEDYLFLKVQIQERVAARERKKLKRKAQNEEYLRKKRDTNNH